MNNEKETKMNIQIQTKTETLICWDAKKVDRLHYGVTVVLKNGKTQWFPGTIVKVWANHEAPLL